MRCMRNRYYGHIDISPMKFCSLMRYKYVIYEEKTKKCDIDCRVICSNWMMPDKKRPKTDSPAANKRVKGDKKEEVLLNN